MSIFIKGMKMLQLEKNKTMQLTLWNDDGIMRVGIQTGGYWCSQEWVHYPVIEVSTPHGRLIDLDAIQSIEIDSNECNSNAVEWTPNSESIVYIDAPTVIEAEGK